MRPGFRGRHGEAGGFFCVGAFAPISLATLTILPIYCNVEDEVSFTLETRESQAPHDFHFSRHSKTLISIWAPVVVKLNPDWKSYSPRGDSLPLAEAELARRYRKHIVQKLRALEPDIVRVTRNAEPSPVSREPPAVNAR